jgi:hypothetical protein
MSLPKNLKFEKKKPQETEFNNAEGNAILPMGNKENYEYSRRTFGDFSQKNSCR